MEKKKLVCQGVSGRKKWAKPKLIVIARANVKENILCACKYTGTVGPNDPCPYTGACLDISSS
jgi:hypothetical protein